MYGYWNGGKKFTQAATAKAEITDCENAGYFAMLLMALKPHPVTAVC